MQFALLGDHLDGVEMACALVATGRHELLAYAGNGKSSAALRQCGVAVKAIGDLEEILADPAIEGVIVAGPLSVRPAQLRRALQSERHVLCVQPANHSADTAYEAAMIQGDTHQLLFPLLSHRLHPGVCRLAELTGASGQLGALRLLTLEWLSSKAAGDDAGQYQLLVSSWEILRRIGGEIAEVSGYARSEEIVPGEALLVAGSFERAGVFQSTYVPQAHDDSCRLRIDAERGAACLRFPGGWAKGSRLTWRAEDDIVHEENWASWSPWPALVSEFEANLARMEGKTMKVEAHDVSWLDATRCLELSDALRRSVQRRRASALEYQEATEEASFKGTMTLVGCGMLWAMILILVLSNWLPRLGWLILPLLVVFLALQLFRWALPRRDAPTGAGHKGAETER